MNSLMNKFFKIVTDANEGSEQNAVWRLLLFEKFGRKKEQVKMELELELKHLELVNLMWNWN